MEPFILSRIQFALNITFHILFPTITIALCWILLFFIIQYYRTHEEKWFKAYKFFVKVFALSFALGVVSGVTMSFQFGTNWPGFMLKVGDIAGPLLAYEVLTAFFLEASFLGIMLYGMNKVSPKVHAICTLMVAIGTTISAFWIVSLNSWMQTPDGYKIVDGIILADDWIKIIFNPSMPYRVVHMLIASGLTAAFLVAGLSAYRVLKGEKSADVLIALKTGLIIAAVLIPLQFIAGDLHGLNTLKHQPAKIAALEAIWETESGASLILFAIPNENKRLNEYEIDVPRLGSIILTHEYDGEIKGLNSFNGAYPPVLPIFFSFRIMVGVGILMLLVSWICTYKFLTNKSLSNFWLKALVAMTFSGWVATVMGWYTTEIGRQPYLVYGLLKTVDAVADHPTEIVATSFIIYLLTYIFLLVSYIYVIFHLAKTPKNKIIPEV